MSFFQCAHTKDRSGPGTNNVTLQVRNPLNQKQKNMAGKRASFSAALKGSMTAEAAVGLTLFLFFIVVMAVPLKIMTVRRQLQAALEAEGERIAKYAYLLENEEKGQGQGDNPLAGLSGTAIALMVQKELENRIQDGMVSDFSCRKSRVMEDGETIDLIMDYNVKLPFSVFSLSQISQQVRCIRRAWTGKEGKNLDKNQTNEEDDGGQIVYVGKGSSRYHRSRTCHYLYNNIAAVEWEQLASLTNGSGRAYRPCARCGQKVTGGTVYVMPEGETYHSRKDCSAIMAYVQAVPLKRVRNLGECSYCAGKELE